MSVPCGTVHLRSHKLDSCATVTAAMAPERVRSRRERRDPPPSPSPPPPPPSPPPRAASQPPPSPFPLSPSSPSPRPSTSPLSPPPPSQSSRRPGTRYAARWGWAASRASALRGACVWGLSGCPAAGVASGSRRRRRGRSCRMGGAALRGGGERDWEAGGGMPRVRGSAVKKAGMPLLHLDAAPVASRFVSRERGGW